MNRYEYQRSLRQKGIVRRSAILLIVVIITGYLAGIATGYIIGSPLKAGNTVGYTNIPYIINNPVYGSYEAQGGIVLPAVEWKGKDMDFKAYDVPMSEEDQQFLYYLARGYDIDYTLLLALIQHESGFRAEVVSDSHDYGLMQINEVNHGYLCKALGVKNFLDPYQNMSSGTFILRQLFQRYDDTDKVLMAYNMGESGAKKLWDKGITESNYSRKILEIQRDLKEVQR